MLKLRLLTALFLLPLFVLAILYLPVFYFSLLCAFIASGCAWEWASLSQVNHFFSKVIYILVLLVAMGTLFFFKFEFEIINYVVFAVWVLLMGTTYRYGKGSKIFLLSNKPLKLLLGFILLLAFWGALVSLQVTVLVRFNALIVGFVLIWAVDVGAYFVGRSCGRHKLIEAVSPNKTWEGFWGGLGCCALVALLFGLFGRWDVGLVFGFILLALIVGCFAVLGDLVESLLKREADVKDSGTLLPGHGGLLDRFDSAIAALPVLCVGLQVIHGIDFGF